MYYTNFGNRSGGCGHAHKDIIAARQCIEAHRRKCARERSTGGSGYSDRQMYAVASRDAVFDPAGRVGSRVIESSEWKRWY